MVEFNNPRCDCEGYIPTFNFKLHNKYKSSFVTGSYKKGCIECLLLPNSVSPSQLNNYDELVEQLTDRDGYACAICKTQDKLQVDHDHDTGKIRSFLCQRCNTLVGFLETTSQANLDKAFNYIDEYK